MFWAMSRLVRLSYVSCTNSHGYVMMQNDVAVFVQRQGYGYARFCVTVIHGIATISIRFVTANYYQRRSPTLLHDILCLLYNIAQFYTIRNVVSMFDYVDLTMMSIQFFLKPVLIQFVVHQQHIK